MQIGAAIDTGRGNADEEHTVEAGVTRGQGSVTGLVVDSHEWILTVDNGGVWPFSDMEMNFGRSNASSGNILWGVHGVPLEACHAGS